MLVLALKVPPLDQLVNAASTVMFYVKTVGAEPLSYQWRFLDEGLPGNVATPRERLGSRDSL